MGTKMALSRPLVGGDGGGLTLTFNELNGVIDVPANSSIYLPLDAATHRYEVKTLTATSNKAVKIKVQLKDRFDGGTTYYESLEQEQIRDIIAIPAADKSGQKRVHAFVTNTGSQVAQVQLNVKIIPMSGGN